jgi:hypothetical protein
MTVLTARQDGQCESTLRLLKINQFNIGALIALMRESPFITIGVREVLKFQHLPFHWFSICRNKHTILRDQRLFVATYVYFISRERVIVQVEAGDCPGTGVIVLQSHTPLVHNESTQILTCHQHTRQ